MMMRWIAPLGAVMIALVGCAGDEDAGRAGAGTRDSAGVVIVESEGAAAVPVWRVSGEPLVEVGGADAGFMLVTAAIRTGNGFVTADAGTGEVRFFDAGGRQLRRVGGQGRGPGEFQHIGWMGTLAGDSLATWDPLLRRVTLLTPDGAYARSFSPAGLDGFFPSVYGAFADGTLLMSNGMEAAGAPSSYVPRRDTMVLLRIGRAGQVVDTIGRFPGPARFTAGPRGQGRSHSLPFGPATSAAVYGDAAYVATGERYEITVHGTDGGLRKRIRNRVSPIPVTRADREGYVANMLQAGGTPQEQRERQAELAAAPFPRTMAPVEGVHVDDQGNVWAMEARAPDTWDRISRWSVFDRDGRRIATVQAPGRFTPNHIGPDWVLARTMDADGTEHVRLYRLTR